VELLREELGVETELERGSGGIFEVKVDGAVVSKKTFLGFPDEGEMVRAVAKALGVSA
jgi:selenoprotein W-related protein